MNACCLRAEVSCECFVVVSCMIWLAHRKTRLYPIAREKVLQVARHKLERLIQASSRIVPRHTYGTFYSEMWGLNKCRRKFTKTAHAALFSIHIFFMWDPIN